MVVKILKFKKRTWAKVIKGKPGAGRGLKMVEYSMERALTQVPDFTSSTPI